MLQQVRVLDVSSGTFGEPTDVAIGGDRIRRIGSVSADPTLPRIDGQGAFLLPALYDSHVHLSFLTIDGDAAVADTLRAFVRQGVLHVQDVGGPLDVIAEMSRQVASGETIGPEIAFAGPMAERPPLAWAQVNEVLPGFTVPMETEADVDRLVASVAEAGGSHLKAFGKWNLSLLRRLLERGRERGLEVVLDPGAPLFQEVPVDTALAIGIRRIEHSRVLWQSVLRPDLKVQHDSLMALGASATRMALAEAIFSTGMESVDRTLLDRLAAKWAASGAYFCPTLKVAEDQRSNPGLPLDVMADVSEFFTSTLAASGVPLLVGQDAMSPTGAIEEMAYLVDVGVSPANAIRAATWNPAKWASELDDLGSVDVGKRADLILVRENPLEDVMRLQDPWAVIQGGVVRVRAGVVVSAQ